MISLTRTCARYSILALMKRYIWSRTWGALACWVSPILSRLSDCYLCLLHFFDQLGYKFDGKLYFNKAMPFGCSIACKTFESFSTFLEFLVARQASDGKLLHYLDDFLFGGKSGTNHCAHIMSLFQEKMKLLGVPIADKTRGPLVLRKSPEA